MRGITETGHLRILHNTLNVYTNEIQTGRLRLIVATGSTPLRGTIHDREPEVGGLRALFSLSSPQKVLCIMEQC